MNAINCTKLIFKAYIGVYITIYSIVCIVWTFNVDSTFLLLYTTLINTQKTIKRYDETTPGKTENTA